MPSSNFRIPQSLINILRTVRGVVFDGVRRALVQAGALVVQLMYDFALGRLAMCVPFFFFLFSFFFFTDAPLV